MTRRTLPPLLCLLLVLCSTRGLLGQSKFLKSFMLTEPAPSELVPSNSISHFSLTDSFFFIGTGRGLAKSTDLGHSWISYESDPAFADVGIFAVAALGEGVWAATGYDKDIGEGNTVQTGSGYAISTDGGRNWIHLNQTIDQRADSLLAYGINDSVWILPVVVPEQNVTFDISYSPGTVWIASWASGLRKSTDNGLHWQRILLPMDDMNSLKPTDTLWSYARGDTLEQHRIYKRFDPRKANNLLAFSVTTAGPDTIWCGTAGGINKSTDGGVSWVKYSHQNQASPILGNWVIAIKEQRFRDVRRLWTTNWKTEDIREDYGVSYTEDDGRTWTNLLRGIKAYEFTFRDSIAYIATDNGIYRTDDGGRSMVRISQFNDPDSHQAIPLSVVYTVATEGDTVFVGTSDGMTSTIDNASHQFGAGWKISRHYTMIGSARQTYAYPNPFSPGLEWVRIHYGAGAPADGRALPRDVRIEIFDFGMNRVRTLLSDAARSPDREYDELWDGTDDGGRTVANGTYFYRITFDSDDPIFGKILVLQ